MKTNYVLRGLSIALLLGVFACKSSTDSTSNNNTTASGDPKMTASPTVTPASGSSGQMVSIYVPVNASTRYISVLVGTTAASQVGNTPAGGTNSEYGYGTAVNSGGAGTIIVAMKLSPTGFGSLVPGKYYIAVNLDGNNAGSDQTTFTSYVFCPTISGSNYSVFYHGTGANYNGSSANGAATSFGLTYFQIQ